MFSARVAARWDLLAASLSGEGGASFDVEIVPSFLFLALIEPHVKDIWN